MTPGRADHTLRMVAPALLIILVFMVAPMLIAAAYSFLTAGAYGGVKLPFTADAYVRFLFDRDLDDSLLFDDTYLIIFGRSIVLAGLTTVFSVLIGLPLAWYMVCRTRPARDLLVLAVTIPFWTNLLIRTYCWVLILRDQGLLNGGLIRLGLIETPITFLYSNEAILLGLVYSFLPFMVLPIYSTLEKLDPRLIEAAHDLYAGRWAAFRHVVWPLAKPGIAAGTALVFVPALGAFLAPDLLGGGKKLMIGSLIQLQFSSSRNWPFGAAASMILMAFVLAALVWSARRRGAGVA
ncbi:spermidine/putrescine transport system permease protein [Pseudoxanthobacter soli DSM 19599]|uniref:Spermidine/putrescine transport system permease protein n=1 Tax=Pseudoxanthobacter soli DSM 19599 TaxID=1123029 RepID=A0A1M7ZR51_9HYPH|nr:ABC transporter permease [Pseudoxanthobacter soli]SHO67383.1 spermidine/putrescine transport system permease protein [Pseudoxanthobacter soli DSM 19599]